MAYRGMGWIPDVPSVRDYTEDDCRNVVDPLLVSGLRVSLGKSIVLPSETMSPSYLPKSVDLRDNMPDVEDQESIGSCTAQAAVSLFEYGERRFRRKYVDRSRLFVYYVTRRMLGWESEDSGAYIRTAMGALVNFGAPPEKYWPYRVKDFKREPPPFVYSYGQQSQALRYIRLDPNGASVQSVLSRIKVYLAAGFPSIFGFPVYSEFEDPDDGKVPLPKRSSRELGGHAVVACGYDDSVKFPGGEVGGFLIRNSWGERWGLDGYCWMSYGYVLEGLAVDHWCLLSSEWSDQEAFEERA